MPPDAADEAVRKEALEAAARYIEKLDIRKIILVRRPSGILVNIVAAARPGTEST